MRSRALLVAAAGAAACEDGARVLLFGDSLTEGLLGNGCRLGPRACFHPYALCLAREFQARATSTNLEFLTHAPDYAPAPRGGACKRRVDVAEAGVSGERVESMIRRLRGLLASRRCVDAVVILAGTNDLASRARARTRKLGPSVTARFDRRGGGARPVSPVVALTFKRTEPSDAAKLAELATLRRRPWTGPE